MQKDLACVASVSAPSFRAKTQAEPHASQDTKERKVNFYVITLYDQLFRFQPLCMAQDENWFPGC